MSRPRSLELPPSARATRVDTSRGGLAVLVAEPMERARDRAPALFVPGFTGSKEDFIAILQPLAVSGRQVIAIDQRGQYESTGSDNPSSYELEELGRDVLAAAAAIGGNVHLVGHSYGGYVARTAVALDGASSAVASLTLIGSGPGRVTGARWLANLELLTAALPDRDMESIWLGMRELERELGEPDPEPDIEAFLHARFLQTHPTALNVAAGQLLADEDRLADLRMRTVPLLVITGSAEDVWSADELVAMADELAAECAVIDGAGHSPAVDRPDQTSAALVAFWEAVEARSGLTDAT